MAATELWAELAAAARAEGRLREAEALGLCATAPEGEVAGLLARAADDLTAERWARLAVTAAGGWRILGRADLAEPLLRAALDASPDEIDAHLGLAHIRMPGPVYYELLAWLHAHLRPALYLEIGMGDGSSMALVRRPTVAVGVDPVPTLRHPLSAECHVYPETSQSFLARPDLAALLGAASPDLVFVDGLHTFPAVLADLTGVAALAGPSTVVAVHDTVPLDEVTQRPDRQRGFYTGDVWKLLACLDEVRRGGGNDAAQGALDFFTVLAPPSGLTIVTGLHAVAAELSERRVELEARHGVLAFDETVDPLEWISGEVVPNDPDAVAARLSRPLPAAG